MSEQLLAGEKFPPVSARNIHGAQILIPAETALVHLQFRRFAGCPICNLHLQSFVRRIGEISGQGIKEVVVFHSSDAELLPYQGDFPFDVIGDPEKKTIQEVRCGGLDLGHS